MKLGIYKASMSEETTTSPVDDAFIRRYISHMNFAVDELLKGTGVEQPQARLFQNGETVDLQGNTNHTRFQFHAEGYVTMKNPLTVSAVGHGAALQYSFDVPPGCTRLSPSAEIHIHDGPDGDQIFAKPILLMFEENWDMSLLQTGADIPTGCFDNSSFSSDDLDVLTHRAHMRDRGLSPYQEYDER